MCLKNYSVKSSQFSALTERPNFYVDLEGLKNSLLILWRQKFSFPLPITDPACAIRRVRIHHSVEHLVWWPVQDGVFLLLRNHVQWFTSFGKLGETGLRSNFLVLCSKVCLFIESEITYSYCWVTGCMWLDGRPQVYSVVWLLRSEWGRRIQIYVSSKIMCPCWHQLSLRDFKRKCTTF